MRSKKKISAPSMYRADRKNNVLRRLKVIDALLSSGKRYTYEELLDELWAEGYTISRRSLEIDLKYIDEEYGELVERKYRNGKVVLRYDMSKGYSSIFAPVLNEEEATLLKGFLEDYHFNELAEYKNLQALIRQSKQILKGKSGAKVHFEETYNSNPLQHFPRLFEAISQKYTISLKYQTIDQLQEEREIKLYPRLLKEYNRRWFLLATPTPEYNITPEKPWVILNFPLDRILHIELVLSEKYQDLPKSWNWDDKVFDKILGVTMKDEAPILDILCWVSPRNYHYLETKPIHWSQKNNIERSAVELVMNRYPSLADGHFISLQCQNNYELRRELLSHGKGLIVLEPQELREELQTQLKEHLTSYQN